MTPNKNPMMTNMVTRYPILSIKRVAKTLHPMMAMAWGASDQERERKGGQPARASKKGPQNKEQDRQEEGKIPRARLAVVSQGENPSLPDDEKPQKDQKAPAQTINRHIPPGPLRFAEENPQSVIRPWRPG